MIAWRRVLAVGGAIAVVAPLGWMWQQSLLPSAYSMLEMGHVEYGGGPPADGHLHAAGEHPHGERSAEVSVVDLVADPIREPDVTAELVVAQGRVRLDSGQEIDGFTVNGSTPGPTLQATVGDLVEVTLRNANVADGATLHWHGVDVPNAADGVAGVTQDAVPAGGEHVYRFVVERPGSYWYHAHQVAHPQVARGLLGALVVLPEAGIDQDHDALALAHTYGGRRTLNGVEAVTRVDADPGESTRVRVVNTDDGSLRAWASHAARLLAIDGTDLSQPTPFQDASVEVPPGGRVDLEVTVPENGAARVQVGKATAMVVGPADAPEPVEPAQPGEVLDVLGYGSSVPPPFDADDADRVFDYRIGRKPGFVDGRPGVWWSINGRIYPDVPMFMVREDEVIRFRIENGSSEAHPMHLHGHRVLLLSRDGRPATGTPLWLDSFDVAAGEKVEVAFRADNPGIWMDHCHNLEHAEEGFVAHLMYEGVTTPYLIGGEAGNAPE